jgi:hypothetical protein
VAMILIHGRWIRYRGTGRGKLRAPIGSTEAPEKDICGSKRFNTLVTLDP